MPPRQPHPVRPSAARGTRCLAKVGPRAASATSERGSETRRLLQRNWGRAADVSVASFLRWGALPRDARFSALVPHARWRNLLASKRRQQLRPLGRNLHRALHSRTSGGGGIAKRIKWLRLTAKHLKVRAGIRRNTIFPGAQGMEPSRSGRPATAGMSATPPLAVAPSANRAFETELSQTLYFGRLVSTGRAGVAEWQTQRT